MQQLLSVGERVWEPVFLTVLVISGLLGLLALVSPRIFARLSTSASQWVDAGRALAFLDRRIDIDEYILPRSRLLGAAVVASVIVLAFFYVRR